MSDDLSRDDAMQIAMKFCGYRERSKKEVEDKLIAKSFNQKIIKVCIERLVELDFLNNIRFSKSFSRGKNNNNRWGKNKIKFHLKNKGLTDDEINRGIESIDEESYLNILKKNIELYNKKLKEPDRNKLIGHLINKGYEMDLILRYIS
ncbi:MAG: regulatory protein RecX [Cytophagales bacterium]|tara:strand:- start:238 stop:681 length:444 start_codon:yes stop_codon:yes gene_type:complete